MSDEPNKVDRNTLIPFGVVISAVTVIISAWGFMDSRFTAIDDSLERQDRRLEKLEDMAGGRWTSTDMQLWVAEFRRLNPTLEVPK